MFTLASTVSHPYCPLSIFFIFLGNAIPILVGLHTDIVLVRRPTAYATDDKETTGFVSLCFITGQYRHHGANDLNADADLKVFKKNF